MIPNIATLEYASFNFNNFSRDVSQKLGNRRYINQVSGKFCQFSTACFLLNIPAKNYYNPTTQTLVRPKMSEYYYGYSVYYIVEARRRYALFTDL